MNLADDCRRLLAAIEDTFGVSDGGELPEEPRGYPDSLALCLIDSIQSLRLRYEAGRGGNADTDGLRQFLETFHEVGGVEGWCTSRELKVSEKRLDHAIWLYESKQSRSRSRRQLEAQVKMPPSTGIVAPVT
ncbi:heme peroxidase superfamily protein [Mycolicibacterium phlei]|uniref:Uncharacterized protein n=1 Tax=Mycolicibacterium phlei DSM 43239 = CCUG 21000 TaxID=1226750 RepID=A0A5N5VEW6_MYCPH|nr:hypothetical protein [Mycolicibacterium phlei]VEG07927.1 heme peroxidase superfamily protein [Mycobacteroides chelonae]AMO59800.1 hypothetical protein MPHLCCUG_00970 [Mycolicibacterium phlei]KAB7759347.1 hypothetical protein MPHL21000_03290 [Mycolicibacterium phlei DSM 43239 = CCUG 21000]KXW61111.1 hypothetical protein MPHL43070_07095 [Mycolicibacterium phlei DSM 43070]KXW61358.1 hypothetical protein MPHL43239_21260 [Mycolicibacterium phlei DSM 43239 = CCUG 21000]